MPPTANSDSATGGAALKAFLSWPVRVWLLNLLAGWWDDGAPLHLIEKYEIIFSLFGGGAALKIGVKFFLVNLTSHLLLAPRAATEYNTITSFAVASQPAKLRWERDGRRRRRTRQTTIFPNGFSSSSYFAHNDHAIIMNRNWLRRRLSATTIHPSTLELKDIIAASGAAATRLQFHWVSHAWWKNEWKKVP